MGNEEYSLGAIQEIVEKLNESPPMKRKNASIDVSSFEDRGELVEIFLTTFEDNILDTEEKEVPDEVLEFYEIMAQVENGEKEEDETVSESNEKEVLEETEEEIEEEIIEEKPKYFMGEKEEIKEEEVKGEELPIGIETPEPESEIMVKEKIALDEVVLVNPDILKPHPEVVALPKLSDEDYNRLKEDIKSRGIIVPLIAKKDNTILAGHNRLQIAKELGFEVPIQYVCIELSNEEEIQFIYKDNVLRRQLSPEQKMEIIRSRYKKEIKQDLRGGDQKSEKSKSSSEVLISLPEKIEEETGIKAGTAGRLLSKIRKEEKPKDTTEDTPAEIFIKKVKGILGKMKGVQDLLDEIPADLELDDVKTAQFISDILGFTIKIEEICNKIVEKK